MNYFILLTALGLSSMLTGQHIRGSVIDGTYPIPGAEVTNIANKRAVLTDSNGIFQLVVSDFPTIIQIRAFGYHTLIDTLYSTGDHVTFTMRATHIQLDDIVISARQQGSFKDKGALNVDIYDNTYFEKNPAGHVYDALQQVNGVRPQLNCNVCNTGDIHINGLEGGYTTVLIDGMPIVSSLSTVYGLFGIPFSLIERIEVVKGPSGIIYGSETIGGVINIITKKAFKAPLVSVDAFGTSWQEFNGDLSFKLQPGKKVSLLHGFNLYHYSDPQDNNSDGFTDLTLQKRFSAFQKWEFVRKENRVFSLAARYFTEDRWGGQLAWSKQHEGTDSIYGESIYTDRFEFIGRYQLPMPEDIMLDFSFNQHEQDSYYGTTHFKASQRILFSQLYWTKKLGEHQLLAGSAVRNTYYDDNTVATASNAGDPTQNVFLLGAYLQNEWTPSDKHSIHAGARLDHHSIHGFIFTPRLAYKYAPAFHSTFRLNAGTGYRVVSIFTEEHAALTGSREVVVSSEIKPEQSTNLTLSYTFNRLWRERNLIQIDLHGFYSQFEHKINADYDTDPNKIIFKNLESTFDNQGVSLTLRYILSNRLVIELGGTLMDQVIRESGFESRPLLTERFNGLWSLEYTFKKFKINYSGNVYSPMRLPLASDLDPRPEYSPWWSVHNVQINYEVVAGLDLFCGVKNLFNWTPSRFSDMLIARPQDPFDKNVVFDASGAAQPTAENPYGLTFDPGYVFAPNQGIRFFVGVRYSIEKR